MGALKRKKGGADHDSIHQMLGLRPALVFGDSLRRYFQLRKARAEWSAILGSSEPDAIASEEDPDGIGLDNTPLPPLFSEYLAIHASDVERQHRRLSSVLDVFCIVLPQRVVNEELGDCLEDLHRRLWDRQSRWVIWTKVAATAFWLLVNSIGYFVKASGIRKAS